MGGVKVVGTDINGPAVQDKLDSFLSELTNTVTKALDRRGLSLGLELRFPGQDN